MSRPYRLQAEYCFYHITSRGNNRKNIFHSDKDRYKFLDYLLQAKEKFLFNLYAYTLMDNHNHLLIETINANLSKIMHIINGSYCSYHNRAHKQVGHLFQGRFKSIVVDKDAYFLTLSAYIHMNPVRAKIVSSPGAYKWSSYKAYIQKKTDGYVDIDKIRSVLGDNLIRYSDFVLGYADTEGKSIFNDLYAGFILGSSNFIKDNLKTLKTQNCDYSKDISYKNELEGSPSAELIVNNIDRIYQKHQGNL
jgi:REP element-mobilizing transposase RayT